MLFHLLFHLAYHVHVRCNSEFCKNFTIYAELTRNTCQSHPSNYEYRILNSYEEEQETI